MPGPDERRRRQERGVAAGVGYDELLRYARELARSGREGWDEAFERWQNKDWGWFISSRGRNADDLDPAELPFLQHIWSLPDMTRILLPPDDEQGRPGARGALCAHRFLLVNRIIYYGGQEFLASWLLNCHREGSCDERDLWHVIQGFRTLREPPTQVTLDAVRAWLGLEHVAGAGYEDARMVNVSATTLAIITPNLLEDARLIKDALMAWPEDSYRIPRDALLALGSLARWRRADVLLLLAELADGYSGADSFDVREYAASLLIALAHRDNDRALWNELDDLRYRRQSFWSRVEIIGGQQQ